MKAICVTSERTLECRNIPAPEAPVPGHVLVDMVASAITHGDKFFLTRPLPGFPPADGHDVYGANGAGVVTSVGDGVPADILGRQVAIYKSLTPSAHVRGLWCERAQVPYASCLVLPDQIDARDLCGSLANVLTVHAFLDEIAAGGRKGVIVTAGSSATGAVAAALSRIRGVTAIFIVRSMSAREVLLAHGVRHVVVSTQDGFEAELGSLAAELDATTIFDGVGGDLLTRLLPHLPMNSIVRIYGFLGGMVPFALPSPLLMARNLTFRRFTVLESPLVTDPARLAAALSEIEKIIGEPLFRTRIGDEFRLDEIDQAMSYRSTGGGRALLVP
jgi:NADPH2:quinone reductase